MQIKIKTFNEDGSVAFEGEFSQTEASLILEVGTNYLLSQGALNFGEEDDEDEDFHEELIDDENSSRRH